MSGFDFAERSVRVLPMKLPYRKQASLKTTVSAVVAVGLFAGCGGKEESVVVAEQSATQEVSTDPPSPPEAELPEGMVSMKDRLSAYRPDTNRFVAAPTDDMTNAMGQAGSFLDSLKAKAEGGHTESAYFLGHKYYEGGDVDQDYKEAFKWLKFGADRNNAKAQSLLGVLYEEGKGVPENKVLAYAWYLIAAKQDDELAGERIPALAEKLSDQDFDEADQLVEGFVPQ